MDSTYLCRTPYNKNPTTILIKLFVIIFYSLETRSFISINKTVFQYMIEIWKDIEGFPKYKVSNIGRVKSCHGSDRILRQNTKKGYYTIQIWTNKKRYDKFVHRLILEAFIPNPNPDKFTICDHINRNGRDNRVENLRWSNSKLNNYNRSNARGYYFEKRTKQWVASLTYDGINKILGNFKYSIHARQAYLAAKKKYLNKIDKYHDY